PADGGAEDRPFRPPLIRFTRPFFSIPSPGCAMEHENSPGKVLRLKTGYNPNSSSVGSSLPQFFAFALASGALAMAGIQIALYFKEKNKKAAETGGAGKP
ncbi:MAG: hypothetical protein AB1921_06095, partial [Thermodesulfobacteriota bacterium]